MGNYCATFRWESGSSTYYAGTTQKKYIARPASGEQNNRYMGTLGDALATEGAAWNLHAVTNVATITPLYDKEGKEKGAGLVVINKGAGKQFVELLGGIR